MSSRHNVCPPTRAKIYVRFLILICCVTLMHIFEFSSFSAIFQNLSKIVTLRHQARYHKVSTKILYGIIPPAAYVLAWGNYIS